MNWGLSKPSYTTRLALAAGALALAGGAAAGWQEPQDHPEMSDYLGVVEQLEQAGSPAAGVLYRIVERPGNGREAAAVIHLSFGPEAERGRGRFQITPSDRIELLGSSGRGELPPSGEVRLQVRARGNPAEQLPYLIVESVTLQQGAERRRVTAVAVPFGVPVEGEGHDDSWDETGDEPPESLEHSPPGQPEHPEHPAHR